MRNVVGENDGRYDVLSESRLHTPRNLHVNCNRQLMGVISSMFEMTGQAVISWL